MTQAAQTKTAATYDGIQLLRAAAALLVALSHLVPFERKYLPGPVLFPAWAEYGQCGVDVFFVISGFIITRSVAGRFGSAREAGRFALRRAIRIYPIYWVYFAIVLALYLARPDLVNSSLPGQPNLLLSFLLLPSASPPLVLVSWTLTYELLFYAVFALAMPFVPERALGQAVAAWAALLVLANLLLPTGVLRANPVAVLVLDPLILEFLAGCLVARTTTGRSPSAPLGTALLAAGLAGLVAGAAALHGAGVAFPGDWRRVAVFGTAATALVAGAVLLEPWLRRWAPRAAVAVGNASYSIYLSHILVIAAIGQAWRVALAGPSAANHALSLAAAVLGVVAAGWASYRLVEAPLQAWLRLPGQRAHQLPSAPPAGSGRRA